MRKQAVLLTAAIGLVLGGAAHAQTAPMPVPRESTPHRATSQPVDTALQQNEFTANNLVGMRVYAPSPTARAVAPVRTGSSASSNASGPATPPSRVPSSASPQPPNVGGPSDSRPTIVTDEQWRAISDGYFRIGEVNDLVMTIDGRIHHVVLGVGGFLGIGEKNVAIGWSDLRLIRGTDGKLFAIVTKTKDELNAMPNFRPNTSQ